MAKKDWMILESELDEDQIKVLMATNEKSCIVSGCAGSGKSVLALIKAQRIQKEKGNNYKIIVFTKALCRYMNAGRETLGIDNQFHYHWEWQNRLNCSSADYFIVDEIQDFTKDEINKFISSTNKNFFFFGDTAQSIYEGLKKPMPVAAISDLFPPTNKPKFFELYRNYRLPKPVAKVVQYIGIGLDGFDISTYKSNEIAVPRFIQYGNLEEQIRGIVNQIKIKNLSDVGILLPDNETVKRVSDLFNKNELNHEIKYGDKADWRDSIDTLDFSTTNPKVMTYHSAKGLQFETVFLPSVSGSQNDGQQKALYVAMTRTYRDLYVMYSGILPRPLSTVPTELFKTTEKDVVEDI